MNIMNILSLPYLNLAALERHCGIPRGTLERSLAGRRKLPTKHEKAIGKIMRKDMMPLYWNIAERGYVHQGEYGNLNTEAQSIKLTDDEFDILKRKRSKGPQQ